MTYTRNAGARSLAAAGIVLVAWTPALGQMVYPAKGQNPQQQQHDQAECQGWAMQQPGATAAPPPPPSGPARPVAGTAARGAAVGAVGGAIAGDAGTGAAAGAAMGALMGGMRRRDQNRAAENAQSQANANFSRAYSACLEGRGYTVR